MYAGPIVPSLCRELGRIIRLRPGALQPEKKQASVLWSRDGHVRPGDTLCYGPECGARANLSVKRVATVLRVVAGLLTLTQGAAGLGWCSPLAGVLFDFFVEATP